LASIAALRQTEPGSLTKLLRGELDWIVMKCLEKDRNRRYDSASNLARDVERHLNGEPVQACPPSTWYRSRKLALRHRTALTLAGLLIAFIVALGSLLGWMVRDREAREREATHDREVRETALDNEVQQLLVEAGPLIDQEKWFEALAVVDRADKLLASAGRTKRPDQLLDLHRDLAMAQRVEVIYRGPSGLPGNGLAGANESSEREFFWGREQNRRFAQAFLDVGIDVGQLPPAEIAARIHRTNVAPVLVRALDEWAAMHKRVRGGSYEDEFWKKLMETAQLADQDEWRNRFRKALLSQNRAELERVAGEIPIREVSAATAYLLGVGLKDLGAVEKARALLREALLYHGDDFWLNDVLGWFCVSAFQPPRYEEALRYYVATVAIRPRNATAHRAVAEILEETRKPDEALAEYSRALELGSTDFVNWWRRGEFFRKSGQYEKAVADYTKGIELEPTNSTALDRRGLAYAHLGQWPKAIADCSRSIELCPDPRFSGWSNRAYYNSVLGQWKKAATDLAVPFGNGTISPDDDCWLQLACLRLLSGDVPGYRRLAGQLLEHVLKGKKEITGQIGYILCRTCLLHPEDQSNLKRIAQWAEQTLASRPRAAWYLHIVALGYYRAGQFDQAERHCRLCQDAAQHWGGRVASKLLLALTLKRLHREEQARDLIFELVKWRETIRGELPGTDTTRPPMHFSDWLEFQVLWLEAEKLFGTEELSAAVIRQGK
jgi:tetratricopeptide (TPR) repeat protein